MLGAVPEHPESSQHLGLCPAAEGHRQPAGTVPPLPGAGAMRSGLRLEQALPVGKVVARLGQGARGLATAGQGSPRSGPEALDWAARRQPSLVMIGHQGGPLNGMIRGPRPRNGGQRGPGVGGRAEQALGLCSIESSPHQVFSRFCALWLCCPSISWPLCFVFRMAWESVCMCVACVWQGQGRLWRGHGRGGGRSAFLSIACEINSWVWSGLFVQEWWSLRSLIVTVN